MMHAFKNNIDFENLSNNKEINLREVFKFKQKENREEFTNFRTIF